MLTNFVHVDFWHNIDVECRPEAEKLVARAMENKLEDNISKGARKGRELHQLKGRLFWRLGEQEKRKFMNALRDKLGVSRKLIQKEHKDQVREIRIEGKKEDKLKLPKELGRYKKAKILQAEAGGLKPGQIIGPVMVGLETNLLTEDEIAALYMGPKFCVRRILNEERFMVECEKCYFKIRLEMKDDDEQDDPGGGQDESEQEKAERLRIEKEIEVAEIAAKTVFNEDENTIDYTRKRATDCKHNTCVRLPGPNLHQN